MQKHTFRYDAENIAYYTAGSADNMPIIFVHGYTSSHHVWHSTIPLFEADYYCVAIDLLGHGDSDIVPEGDYSIDAQAKRVLALADLLGFDDFALVGHSMGGQISLQIASVLAPNRVSRLVDVSGVVIGELTPKVNQRVFLPLRIGYNTPFASMLESIMRRLSHYKWYAGYQYRTWFHDMKAMLRRFDEWQIDREYATQKGMVHSWWHGMNAIESLNVSDTLHHITAPTLILFGAQDGTVPVGDGHLAQERIPISQLVLIEDCGHFPMHEKPDQYQQALQSFLSDKTKKDLSRQAH